MKVLFISARADFGGGPEHIHLLAQGLRKHIRIYIACPKDRPYWEIYSMYFDGLIEIPHRKFSISTLQKLIKYVGEEEIDIIHSHGKGAGLYSRMLGIWCSKPIIHTFHGLHYEKYNTAIRNLYLIYEKIAGLYTAKFINISHSEQNDTIRLRIAKRSKTVLIYNGISLSEFNVDNKNQLNKQIRNELSIPFNDFVIITISRLSKEKGIIRSLDVIKNLVQKSNKPNFRYLLVGDGDELAETKKYIKSNKLEEFCILTGYRTDKERLLAAADVYLSASYREGLPLSLLEAMAYKVPIVATNVPGNVDLLNGGYGFLYSEDNFEEAANYIMAITNSPDRIANMVERAYGIVQEKYDDNSMVNSMMTVYKQILSSKKNGGKK